MVPDGIELLVPLVPVPLFNVGLNDVPVVSQSVVTLEGVDVPEAVVLPIVVELLHGLPRPCAAPAVIRPCPTGNPELAAPVVELERLEAEPVPVPLESVPFAVEPLSEPLVVPLRSELVVEPFRPEPLADPVVLPAPDTPPVVPLMLPPPAPPTPAPCANTVALASAIVTAAATSRILYFISPPVSYE